MKNPRVKEVSKWCIYIYFVWSVAADISLAGGIIYYAFFR